MRSRDIATSLIVVAVLGLSAAVFLVPKGDLNQEARLATMSGREALALLNAAQTPLPPPLAFRRAELTAQAGDALLADQLLADLTMRTERTAIIAAARADLAIRVGDLQKAADHLATAHHHAPTPERRQKLATLYQKLGDRIAERRTLAASTVTELTGPELIRLVDLMAADTTPEEAFETAWAAAPFVGQNAPALAGRLAALALVTKQSTLLAQTASTWLSEPETQTVALSLAEVLALRPPTARTFAEAVVSQAPDTRAPLTKAFTEVRLFDVARFLLYPWTDANLMTDASWDAVIFYADQSGDLRPLEHLLQQIEPSKKLPIPALLPLIRYGDETALLPYQPWLTPEYLESAPLVGAAWALARQRPDEAFSALQHAMQTEHDPALWKALADRLQDTVYYGHLRSLSADVSNKN